VIFSSTALIDGIQGTAAFATEKLRRFRSRYALSPESLGDLVTRFREKKIAVIGDYLLDRYHFCEATGVSSEGPCMSLRSLRQRDEDGGAAVIALHLAGLGAQATLVSGFANDPLSRDAQQRLRTQGVEVAALNCRRQTTIKNRYLVDTQKMLKVDEGTQGPIDSAAEESLTEIILSAVQGADAIIFADFAQGLLTASLLQRVMPGLRNSVPLITATVSGKQSNLMRFQDVDLLCATEQEVRESLHDYSSGLTAVAWQLMTATRAPQVIITLGKQGLVVCDRHQMVVEGEPWERRLRNEYVPTFCPQPADTLGCGDALLATATLTLASGGSVQAAGLLGSAAAAAHASRIGNPPVAADDLFTWIGRSDFTETARLAS
jgi:rfaE bifunctional protein kinase chain/domain